jgi:sulfur carrier protein
MRLTVNGESRTLAQATSIQGLLEVLDLTEGPVAVERNREVVPRARHATTWLADGDVIEIVHFVGGG